MKKQASKENSDWDIAIYPQFAELGVVVLNIAFHNSRGILSQRPAWQPEICPAIKVPADYQKIALCQLDDYILLIPPTHEVYPFLKSKLLKLQALSDTEFIPVPAIGIVTLLPPSISPTALTCDDEGKVNPSILKLFADKRLYTKALEWMSQKIYSDLRIQAESALRVLQKRLIPEASPYYQRLESTMRFLDLIDDDMNLKTRVSREAVAKKAAQSSLLIRILQFLISHSK